MVRFIWNPSNCESQCYKSCDIDEYLDYENCKCRKKLVDKLIEECTENVEETMLIETSAENEHKCSSCTVYRVLFWIFFLFFVYFTYYKQVSCNKENVAKYDYTLQTTI